MAKKRYYNSMISIDEKAPALCPRSVIEKEIPGGHGQEGVDQYVPDLLEGVNQLMGEDESNLRRKFAKTKKS